ncbi:MAG: hypothetical protein GX677_08700 [Treponema sp.]|nr:hypothetical protein [Treponema sp.]
MNNLLNEAVTKAFMQLVKDVDKQSVQHWNESVFRYILTKELGMQHCYAEWKRIDLIFDSDSDKSIGIELKFYRAVSTENSKMITQGLKGSAGKKNTEEFINSWNKLFELQASNSPIAKAWGKPFSKLYVVLVTIDDSSSKHKKFADSYFNNFSMKPILKEEEKKDNLEIKVGIFEVTKSIELSDFSVQ